jgi:hypothetical protein
MTEVDIPIPPHWGPGSVPRRVERACAAQGLALTLKGTLKKYPGCVHWHFKHGLARGTLEATWWGRERRLWFKIGAGRTGAWMTGAIRRLRQRLAGGAG